MPTWSPTLIHPRLSSISTSSRPTSARAQDTLASHGLANRPHIKTHKIPALAKLQMDAGAVGITCQKLGEVEVMADAGVADDILLTYNVLGDAKAERLAALIRRLEAHGGRARQRGGGARALRSRQAPRRRHPLPDRVRHRLRPQRRAEPAGRARPRARGDAAAEHAVRRADDLPDRQARAAPVARTRAAAARTAPASRCRSSPAAARPR